MKDSCLSSVGFGVEAGKRTGVECSRKCSGVEVPRGRRRITQPCAAKLSHSCWAKIRARYWSLCDYLTSHEIMIRRAT